MRIKITQDGFIDHLLKIIAILLLIPIGLTGYLYYLVQSTELGLVDTQRQVMEKAMTYLDDYLPKTFNQIINDVGVEDIPQREQAKALNKVLQPIIIEAKKVYPNLDVGYYWKDYDVILDGNNIHLRENFSTRRKNNFDDALSNKSMVFQVFGGISENGQLEAYQPIIRDGKIIGAVWASSDFEPISQKIVQMKQVVYGIISIGIFLAFGGTFSLIRKFTLSVNDVKKNLSIISNNPTFIIPRAPGELGEITEAINQMYNKLIDVQNYNQEILTSIDDGIITVNKEQKIVSINLAAYHMLSLGKDILGQSMHDVFLENSPFKECLNNTLLDNQPVKDVEVIYEDLVGNPRHLLISTSLMVNVRQDLVGALLHFRDITELIHLREDINRQERFASLGKIIAGVAHEIRSPLTSITGYMQFWNQGHVPSQKSLNIVNREMTRLANITDELLQFARPSRATLIPCQINSLVKRLGQFFVDAHGDRVELVTTLGEDLPEVMIDQYQIEKVLSNIMYNAFQSTEGKGKLETSTFYDKTKNMVGISIKDNGCGITEENLTKIFEPFFTTKSKGTGLGLAIAREILEAHKGVYEVESKVDVGTVIKIFIPIAESGDNNG
ncbi:two-component system sensor histidine kinase AtoS [Desulfosporosinus sp. BICA1-9]|uniref:two-component system sensor histidine kinase AtoS n=1 Tax=Desulfosporosinus sp. BICA1-9 TaxID=1531958 RepID=UPI00054C5E67|nr:two-component system sensor histidine kinase AtoS [Desulfosporosinus sp. BICA1-9]KJS50478.1 MAG: histidine kinase [Peptococcaceae bacterium BRH_c23]KJS85372.1 MAG: histidine kinase [Desulfosporosinus sp. BICA1-9]HBW36854.1 two-component system sensor histidine kinase AtoS [Desulfosporosinus sp.]